MSDHVRLTPVGRVRVRLSNELIVDTTRGYVVHEGNLSARYYVPREDIHAELVADKVDAIEVE